MRAHVCVCVPACVCVRACECLFEDWVLECKVAYMCFLFGIYICMFYIIYHNINIIYII